MPSLVIGDARLNYLQLVPDDPHAREDLVMVHGLAANLAFWYSVYGPAFSKRFRVTLLDLRGHGHSQTTPSGYTPAALSADLSEALNQLGIRRAHLVAHSFGGVVALGFACREPWRVRSLVLADSHLGIARASHPEQWEPNEAIQTLIRQFGLSIDARDPFFGFHLLTEVSRLLVSGSELPPETMQVIGPMFGKFGRRSAKQWLDLMTKTNAETELRVDDGLTVEILQSLRVPTLALYGERSMARPTADLLPRIWPHADFRLIPGAGHFFPATRAAEMIAACEQFWSDRIVPSSRPSSARRPAVLMESEPVSG